MTITERQHDKHDHWDKHADHDRHHDRDHDCEWNQDRWTRPRAATANANGMRTMSITGGNASIATTATMAERPDLQPLSQQLPRRLRLSERRLWLSRRRLRLPAVRYTARYGGGAGSGAGYGFGFQDGSYMARKDISQNKPFNPNPRNESGNRITATTVHSATRTPTRPHTIRATPPATSRTIAAARRQSGLGILEAAVGN